MMRLKRASYLLAFRSHYRIIDIAILAGFESGESLHENIIDIYLPLK